MLGTIFNKPLQEGEDGANTYAEYARAAQWCNENGAAIEDRGDYYEVVATPEPSQEEKINAYVSVIQNWMDKTVQARGYDNVFTCISYLNDKNEKYAAEARAVFDWRSAVWTKGYEILNKVLSGEMGLPAIEDVIAELPELEWSDYGKN